MTNIELAKKIADATEWNEVIYMKIKKLNESTKFKVNDKVFVKPNKKQGRVLKVKGDYITV